MPFDKLFKLFWFDWFNTPHALSSVNISVKKPGSAFIRSILPLRRFTISKHLCGIIQSENGVHNSSLVHSTSKLRATIIKKMFDLLTYPRIYPSSLRPKMVSTDNLSHCPCMNMTDTNMLKQMLAAQTLLFRHRRPAHEPTCKRTQHLLGW